MCLRRSSQLKGLSTLAGERGASLLPDGFLNKLVVHMARFLQFFGCCKCQHSFPSPAWQLFEWQVDVMTRLQHTAGQQNFAGVAHLLLRLERQLWVMALAAEVPARLGPAPLNCFLTRMR